MNDWMTPHLFTVDEYYKMAEVGILQPDARVELIEGVIVDMSPATSLHDGILFRCLEIINDALRMVGHIRCQGGLKLNFRSLPQPDIIVVCRRSDFYVSHHPGPEDTLLAIEVSNTSARFDRWVKAPLYARHGIPEYWNIDVIDRVIHRYRAPEGDSYTDVTSVSQPGLLEPVAFPGVFIDLSTIFATSEISQ